MKLTPARRRTLEAIAAGLVRRQWMAKGGSYFDGPMDITQAAVVWLMLNGFAHQEPAKIGAKIAHVSATDAGRAALALEDAR